MKFIKRLLNLAFILILTLIFIQLFQIRIVQSLEKTFSRDSAAISQTGNFSDATGPSLSEGAGPESRYLQPLSSQSLEQNLETADSLDKAVQIFELFRATEWSEYFRKKIVGTVLSVAQISDTLGNLARTTGNNPILIYMASLPNELRNLYIFPNTLSSANLLSPKAIIGKIPPQTFSNPQIPQSRPNSLLTLLSQKQSQSDKVDPKLPDRNQAGQQVIPEANRDAIAASVANWREEIALPPIGPGPGSLAESQKLYQWLIQPLEPALQANQIDTLVFSMDAGLRSLPIAALHDGKQFLIEKYSIALIPSFGLTDTRYVDVRNQKILAMGAAEFPDSNQSPLPAVPVELSTILRPPWKGVSFLNKDFTLDKLISVYRAQRFGIIHLATHAQFKQGDVSQSFIQFGNSQLRLDRVREVAQKLGWPEPPPVEMLVLSACETALGNEPELGFAGLAVQAGVKSAIASLWRVDDVGTLALMSEFYWQLRQTPIKAEALRRSQLAMLRKQVRIEDGKLWLSQGEPIPLPPSLAAKETMYFSHPHYWAGFTAIGNWN